MARRPKRKFGPAGDAAANLETERVTYGRDRGKSAARPAAELLQTSTFGPIVSNPTYPGPLGLTFRNIESHSDNADRIQVIQQMWRLSLTGSFAINANGSTLPADNALDWIDTYVWQKYYEMIWNMGQRRDGYRATAAPPLNTPAIMREYTEMAMTAQINIRVLMTLVESVMVNPGMQTMLTAIQGIHLERIKRDYERANQFQYPACFIPWVEYWSKVFSNGPDGPIVINLFDFQAIEDALPHASLTFHGWAGSLPDLSSATDWGYLLDDIELATTMLLEHQTALGANDAADLLNLLSALDMSGAMMPAPNRSPLSVDPQRFIEQFKLGAFYCRDTKGVGVDTAKFWPDMGGSLDTLININPCGLNLPPDDLFWIGAKGPYAWEADDSATPGYCAESEDLTALGCVMRVYPGATIHVPYYPTRIYTKEDGWAEIVSSALDFTAASGLQEFLWKHPWLTCHPDSWRVIMDEESEEVYHIHFLNPGFQVPVYVFSEAYRHWLINGLGLPFVI
jgi:hypothetical protein